MATFPTSFATKFNTVFETGEAFSPMSLGSLVTWLDASDLSTITEALGKVSQWDDKSGNGHHATQAVAASQPDYTVSDSRANSHSSIGSSSPGGGSVSIGMELPAFSFQNLYVVTAYEDGTDSTFDRFQYIIGGRGSNGFPRILGQSGSANLNQSGSNFANEAEINGGAATSTVLPLDLSVLKFSGSMNEIMDIMHSEVVAGRTWDGPFCEFVFTDGSETSEEEQELLDYFYGKWSIS